MRLAYAHGTHQYPISVAFETGHSNEFPVLVSHKNIT